MVTEVAPNRKARRAKGNRLRTGLATAAAVTSAAALTVGVSAPAAAPRVVDNANIMLAADPITLDVITTGGVFGLLNALGFDSIPINQGDTTLATINLNYVSGNGADVYNAINAVPMAPTSITNCGLSGNKNGCRLVPVATYGGGANTVRDAMNAIWALALGQQLLPAGNTDYTALKAGDSVTIGALINDTLRPNGGLAARFTNATSTVPTTGSTVPCADNTCEDKPGQDKTKAINNFLDVTWEYQPQADFPANFNLLAMTNSFFGNLPPIAELYTQYMQTGAASLADDIAVTLGVGGPTYRAGSEEATGALLSTIGAWAFGASPAPDPQLYATLYTGALPLFEPNAIGTLLVNNVLAKIKAKFVFGTPLADVLTPALTILINTAYPDVLTPEALKANPDLVKEGYKAYDRTFAQQQVPFGSFRLTRDQQKEANVAAWNAFTTSLKEQAQKPFFGIIEPLLQTPGASVKPVAAAKAAPAPAASAAAPVVEAPAPVEAPAAVVDVAALAESVADEAPAPQAPTARAHTRKAASSDSAGDTSGGRGSGHSGSRGAR